MAPEREATEAAVSDDSDRPTLDELAERWVPERDTAKLIKRIESSAPPASYPGRHWTPAGVVLVITAFGGLMTTIGVVIAPLFTKPDLTGYVKEERLTACEAKLDTRAEAHDKAVDDERKRTSGCFDRLGACQSQLGAKVQVIESLGTKRRR
jgi:hypothetical protein